MLLKQAKDKIHRTLLVAVLGKAERLVDLPHQGDSAGWPALCARTAATPPATNSAKQQDCTQTICGCPDRHI